jgi:hypothetical protein
MKTGPTRHCMRAAVHRGPPDRPPPLHRQHEPRASRAHRGRVLVTGRPPSSAATPHVTPSAPRSHCSHQTPPHYSLSTLLQKLPHTPSPISFLYASPATLKHSTPPSPSVEAICSRLIAGAHLHHLNGHRNTVVALSSVSIASRMLSFKLTHI